MSNPIYNNPYNNYSENDYQYSDPYAQYQPSLANAMMPTQPINYGWQQALLPSVTANTPATYAKGGKIKKQTKKTSYRQMTEKGTELPEFKGGGLFGNPRKWFKSNIGPAAGAIIGNMILPGIGGVVGGAIGGAAGSAVRGRKDHGQAAMRGAAMGALAPTAAGLAGSGASALGANELGASLTNYGNTNAIMPALGRTFGFGSGAVSGLSGNTSTGLLAANMLGGRNGESQTQSQMPYSGVSADDDKEKKPELGFVETLMGKTKNYLTDPANLLTLGVVGSSFMNRPKAPKEKSPEQLADEKKRFNKSLMLSPAELAEKEAYELAEEQARRRLARKKFLPEERLGPIDPIYRKTHSPEEYAQTGRWMSYYNNPEFAGGPLNYKEGGYVDYPMEYEYEEENYPAGLARYIQGHTGGQDDLIPALLSDGEYVIDASTVAHLGDGNNTAGAKKLDGMVRNIRKHKGGSLKLPPKSKSLASYIRG